MNKTEKIINTLDADGKDLKLRIIKPTNKIAQQANMLYNAKISELIRNNDIGSARLLLRSEVETYLAINGIWTERDVAKIEDLSLAVRAHELLLMRGGISLERGRKLAIKMGEMRTEILALAAKRNQLDSATIETMAEDYKFNVLVSECTFHANTNTRYFTSHDDYIERGDETAAIAAAEQLSHMLYGYNPNFGMELFENKWLQQAGFMNDDGRYVDRNGQFIDREGKLVNEAGRYIDSEGDYTDQEGRAVDTTGDFLVKDAMPFTDENGGEVFVIQEKPEKKKTTNNKKKKKKKITKKKSNKKTAVKA